MNPEGKVALAVPSHEQRILHFYLENGGDLNEIPIDVAPMLWIAQKCGLYIIYFNRALKACHCSELFLRILAFPSLLIT